MSYFAAQKVMKRQRRARRNGLCVFSSEDKSNRPAAIGRRFDSGITHRQLNAKTRLGTYRKWLNAEVSGQFGGLKCRKRFTPWQCAARLGSPHLELARLTVSKLLTRCVRRVNRHTHKKAVMIFYPHAGPGQVLVDTQATVARQATGTPAKGRSQTA